ncbi:hypothetical protein AKO1_012545 [Acrasis kona]|uniref:Translin-associated protein X n=1 Tax=Acrasis kona TaxID=1008807 RepID=A0AAW2YXH8_9EUKA
MPRRGKGVERQKLDVSSLSPMEKMFAEHSSILDEFHDTKERIYKFARDVTIVSKRIIFTLHRFGEGVEEQILKESADELHTVKTTHLQNIVKELSKSHLSYWRYIQSYSFGLQEFIEALSFMHYLKTKQLITKEEIEQQLIFDVLPEEEEKVDIKELPESKRIKLDVDHMDTSDDMGSNEKQYPTADGGIIIDGSRIHFKLSYNDYLLGIADLGGELMRYATNNVTKPSMRQVPFEIRDFLQLIGHWVFVTC